MDSNEEHLKNISEIRSIMERSSTFISLSGLSGVSAGIIALISTYLINLKMQEFPLERLSGNTRGEVQSPLFYFLGMAAIVLLVTFSIVIFFTARKAKKNDLKIWDKPAKRLLINLFIPLISGGIFCLLIIYHGVYMLLFPSMLMFYGLALLNASKYTLHDIRFLGISEIILGLLAGYWTDYGLLFWGAGFGILNIIYGVLMYLKYER